MCQTPVVCIDRSPLVFLSRVRMSRWRLFLQGFDVDMQQVAGKTTRSVMLFQSDFETPPPVSPGLLSPAGSQAILSSTQSLSLSLTTAWFSHRAASQPDHAPLFLIKVILVMFNIYCCLYSTSLEPRVATYRERSPPFCSASPKQWNKLPILCLFCLETHFYSAFYPH